MMEMIFKNRSEPERNTSVTRPEERENVSPFWEPQSCADSI